MYTATLLHPSAGTNCLLALEEHFPQLRHATGVKEKNGTVLTYICK